MKGLPNCLVSSEMKVMTLDDENLYQEGAKRIRNNTTSLPGFACKTS